MHHLLLFQLSDVNALHIWKLSNSICEMCSNLFHRKFFISPAGVTALGSHPQMTKVVTVLSEET